MSADSLQNLVRLAAALVVLASLVGQGGRWPRVRQRLARAISSVNRTSRGSAAAGPSPGKKSRAARDRRHALVRELAIALWLAILLVALVTNLRDEFSPADSGRVHLLADH